MTFNIPNLSSYIFPYIRNSLMALATGTIFYNRDRIKNFYGLVKYLSRSEPNKIKVIRKIYKMASIKLHGPKEILKADIESDKKRWVINYSVNEQNYKIMIPRKFSISLYEKVVTSESKQDITNIMNEWIGINKDFHGQSLTPQDIGIDEDIICHTIGGCKKTIKNNEVISF